MKNSILSAGLYIYWPIGLACAGGVILVIIAVLALLLIKGQTEVPTAQKSFHAVPDQKENEENKQKSSAEEQIEVQFFRIGHDMDVRKKVFVQNQWYSVGSGGKVDFCLDVNDCKLEEIHFRICIDKLTLLVAAVGGETFVNGVPIQKLGVIQAYSGDLIRAGSHEYRVIFLPYRERENVT